MTFEDEYVAWVRYKAGSRRSIETCDSDAEGAFRVYRYSTVRDAATAAERERHEAEEMVRYMVEGIEQRERDAVLELVAKWREKAKIWGEHYVRTGVGQDRVMSRMFTERTDELEAALKGKP